MTKFDADSLFAAGTKGGGGESHVEEHGEGWYEKKVWGGADNLSACGVSWIESKFTAQSRRRPDCEADSEDC